MKKNVGSQVIGVQMINAADGTAFTGTATVVITGDGGTQSASGGTGPTHEGNGYHTYIPTQAETNFDLIAFTFTGSGAIPVTVQVFTTFPQTGDSFARIGAPAGASVSADIADVPTVAEFEARTLVAASYFDPATDAVANVTLVGTTTTNTDMRGTDNAATAASVSALNDISTADVNAQVVDVIRTDTATELAAVPAASPALHTMIQWVYMVHRNKVTSTATASTINNDAGTAVGTSVDSDDATTFTRGEFA